MNEQSNDLLAAFENPDMAPEMPQAPVAPAPEVNAAPVQPAPAMVDPAAVMPQEFQNAPEATPVETPVAPAPVAPTPEVPVQPAPAAPVQEAPAAPVAETPAPEADNQNVMPNVSEDPVVSVAQEAKKEEPKEETSVKKNLIFIIIFCVVIAIFIIFLPKIMELFGGSF